MGLKRFNTLFESTEEPGIKDKIIDLIETRISAYNKHLKTTKQGPAYYEKLETAISELEEVLAEIKAIE